MSPFFVTVLWICLLGLILSGILCLYRMFIGPRAGDRAVAFDTLGTVFIAIICVLGIAWESVLYFDAVWILTILGFLGSASIARYLERGRIF
ncbi:MAG: monovalent cation/H+ antiporter complex subunit F [Candidatus Methylomirabilota bacterium]